MKKITRTYPTTKHTAGELADRMLSVLENTPGIRAERCFKNQPITICGEPKIAATKMGQGRDEIIVITIGEYAKGVAFKIAVMSSLLYRTAHGDTFFDSVPPILFAGSRLLPSSDNQLQMHRILKDLVRAADDFMVYDNA